MPNVTELYGYLKTNGAIGEATTQEAFSAKMQDKEGRQSLFAYMKQNSFIGDQTDFNSFDSSLGPRNRTTFENIGDITGKALKSVENAVQDAGKNTQNVAGQIETSVGNAFSGLSKSVPDAVSSAGEAVTNAGQAVKNALTPKHALKTRDFGKDLQTAKEFALPQGNYDNPVVATGKGLYNSGAAIDQLEKRGATALSDFFHALSEHSNPADEQGKAILDNVSTNLKNYQVPLPAGTLDVKAKPGSLADYSARTATEIGGRIAPAVIVGLVTKNPAAATTIMAGEGGLDAYQKAKDAGLTPDKAAPYAITSALIQKGIYSVPVGYFLKPELNIVQRMIGGAATGGLSSYLGTGLQMAVDKGTVRPDMTLDEALHAMNESGAMGAFLGGVMSAASHPFVYRKDTIIPDEQSGSGVLLKQLTGDMPTAPKMLPEGSPVAPEQGPASSVPSAPNQSSPIPQPPSGGIRYDPPSQGPVKTMGQLVHEKLQGKKVATAVADHPQVQQYYTYMVEDMGLTPIKAAGILGGGILPESKGNPAASHKTSGASGLFQHLGSRKSGMISAVPDWKTNPLGQINYAMTEPQMKKYLAGNYHTVDEAVKAFTTIFEIPHIDKAALAQEAQRRSDSFSGKALPPATLPAGTTAAPASDPAPTDAQDEPAMPSATDQVPEKSIALPQSKPTAVDQIEAEVAAPQKQQKPAQEAHPSAAPVMVVPKSELPATAPADYQNLYHGGASGLQVASVDKAGSIQWPEEKAVWLSPSRSEAEFYASQHPDGKGQVYGVSYRPKNPLVVEHKDWYRHVPLDSQNMRNVKKAEWIKKARELGHDSVIFKDTEAFSDIKEPHDEIAVLGDVPLVGINDKDSEFLKSAEAAYAHTSHTPSNSAKAELQWADNAADNLRSELSKHVSDSQTVESAVAEFRKNYMQQRAKVFSVRKSSYSVIVAGASKFNSKQAGKRSSAVDNAEESFGKWLKSEKRRIHDATGATEVWKQKQFETAKAESEGKKKADELVRQGKEAQRKLPIVNQKGKDHAEITKEQWAKTHADYKMIQVSADGSYRYRSMIVNGSLTPVYLVDQKEVQPSNQQDRSPLAEKEPESKKQAASFRSLADSMQNRIKELRNPGVSRQNLTARRANIAANMGVEADRIECIQHVLSGIADDLEDGTLPKALWGIRTKAQVEEFRPGVSREWRYAQPSVRKSDVMDVLKSLKGKPGIIDLRDKLTSFLRARYMNDYMAVIRDREDLTSLEALVKIGNKYEKKYTLRQLSEDVAQAKRLFSAGITDEKSYNAAKEAIDAYVKAPSAEELKAKEIKKAESALIGSKIPGFFPTPKRIVNEMLDQADIQPGMSVLEPSAGKGDIAEVIRSRAPEAKLTVAEIVPSLSSLLEKKGFHVADSDFMEHQGQYDRIIMNPPFENGADGDHVRHAYELLNPGGRLVSIMGEGTFSRRDKKATAFREWLKGVDGSSEKMDSGSFSGAESFRQTGTATRMIVIEKPEEVQKADDPDTADTSILEDVGLLRQVGDRWKYKFAIDGSWMTANSKSDAVERATEAYRKASPDKLLTSEQRFAKANDDEYEMMHRNNKGASLKSLEAKYESMGGEIASHQKAGAREFNGNGGRRTGAAVSAEAARGVAEERMRLGRYIEKRRELEAAKTGNSAVAAYGAESKILAGGKEFGTVRYALLERDDLIVSHVPPHFTLNPKFPQDRQPRDYTNPEIKARTLEIIDSIEKGKFSSYFQKNLESETGMPVVNSQGVVLSGNNRAMAIFSGYSTYAKALADADIGQYGIDTGELKGVKRPVLVRVFDHPEMEQDFAVESNREMVKPQVAREVISVYKALPENKRIEAEQAIRGIYEVFASSGRSRINEFLGSVEFSSLPTLTQHNLKESKIISGSDIQGNQFTSVGEEKIKTLATWLLNRDIGASEAAFRKMSGEDDVTYGIDKAIDLAIGPLLHLKASRPDEYRELSEDLGRAIDRFVEFRSNYDFYRPGDAHKANGKSLSVEKAKRGLSVEQNPLTKEQSRLFDALNSSTQGSLSKLINEAVVGQKDMFADVFGRSTPKPKESPDDEMNRNNQSRPAGYQKTYTEKGMPDRPENGLIKVGSRIVKLSPEDGPTRVESIRQQVEEIIGRGLYNGKIKSRTKAGFYRLSNGELRVRNLSDVEVLAHEMAHYLGMYRRKTGNEFNKLYTSKMFKATVEQFSYTGDRSVILHEGFAEYVRLWLTQYDVAMRSAPDFTKAFEHTLSRDKGLKKRMQLLQDDMHRWYYQGDSARLRAKSSGNQFSIKERVRSGLAEQPARLWRQQIIDNHHAAKVMERELTGGIPDAERSATKQLDLLNGVEGIIQESFIHGAPAFNEKGEIVFHGASMQKVWGESLKKGRKIMSYQEDYFVARRSEELKAQGRENLITVGEIKAGLAYAQKFPWFEQAFEDYQKYRVNFVHFLVDCGYVEPETAMSWLKVNKNYVPFNREVDGIGRAVAGVGSTKRLKGGTQNIKDVYDNMILGDARLIAEGLKARAMRTLYTTALKSEDGSKFLTKLAPDCELVHSTIEQQAKAIAGAMAHLGLTLSRDGLILTGDAEAEQITEISDIEQVLLKNPELMQFWMFGQKPRTVSTMVDSFIDEVAGKRVWIEISKDNELLVNMLDSMAGVKMPEGIMKWVLRACYSAKQLQTMTITQAWNFAGGNIVRDTQEAFARSGGTFRPVVDNLIGMKHILNDLLKQEGRYHEMKAQGGGWAGAIRSQMTDIREMENGGIMTPKARSQYNPIRLGREALEVLMWASEFFEMSTRVGYYSRLRGQGVGARESAWQSRQITTDFRTHGADNSWTLFQRTIPFFAAYIQAVDRDLRAFYEVNGEMKIRNLNRTEHGTKIIGRNGGGQPPVPPPINVDSVGGDDWVPDNNAKQPKTKAGRGRLKSRKVRMYLAAGALVAWNIMNAIQNADDERYKELTPDQKARFLHFFNGDQHLTIPKTHGIVSLLMASGQAVVDHIKGEDSGDSWKYLAFAVAYELSADLIPGLIRPVYDLAVNKTFTGAPIIAHRLEGVDPKYQFTDRTPQLYVNLGKSLGVSPDAAHYLVKGYTGYLSDFIDEASERMLWDKKAWGERPFSNGPLEFMDKPFVQREVPFRTKYTDDYYDLKKQAATAKATVDHLMREPEIQFKGITAGYLTKTAQTLYGIDGLFKEIDNGMKGQDEYMASVKYSPELSAQEKEKKINAYYARKNEMYGKVYGQIKSAVDRIDTDTIK
jgi:hypothetical protein